MTIRESCTAEQQAIADKTIRNRIYQAVGQAFEDLFVDIQRRLDPSFRAVKPQGPKGDKKNDGFGTACGTYYQVYAPEVQETKKLLAKLDGVFPELKTFWDTICPVESFYYAINDNFRGTFPDVEHRLGELKRQYGLKICKPYLAADMVDDFFRLSEADGISMIGLLPAEYAMDELDYGVLAAC